MIFTSIVFGRTGYLATDNISTHPIECNLNGINPGRIIMDTYDGMASTPEVEGVRVEALYKQVYAEMGALFIPLYATVIDVDFYKDGQNIKWMRLDTDGATGQSAIFMKGAGGFLHNYYEETIDGNTFKCTSIIE